MAVINHYNAIPNNPANTNLDNRLNPPGPGTQNLNLTTTEKEALEAFLKTLTGTDVYTNPIWSDPFDVNGNITLTGGTLSTEEEAFGLSVTVYPNPVVSDLKLRVEGGDYQIQIFNVRGQLMLEKRISGDDDINLSHLNNGVYLLNLKDNSSNKVYRKKFIKQ